jgi:hypothetical protein
MITVQASRAADRAALAARTTSLLRYAMAARPSNHNSSRTVITFLVQEIPVWLIHKRTARLLPRYLRVTMKT